MKNNTVDVKSCVGLDANFRTILLEISQCSDIHISGNFQGNKPTRGGRGISENFQGNKPMFGDQQMSSLAEYPGAGEGRQW